MTITLPPPLSLHPSTPPPLQHQHLTLQTNKKMMEDLIPMINKLQDVLATVGTDMIDLPQIVVVGSQSSGKSSVLEAIVGRDFLPRGTGIVTRRPLILQLVKTASPPSPGSSDGASSSSAMPSSGPGKEESEQGEGEGEGEQQVAEETAEFLHLPGKVFTSFSAVRDEIAAETDRETGTNKGISDAPISLKIYSPRVLDLTLVDLPGITKVPVGDQPSDIEVRIRDMVLHYIAKSNALILAVTAANSDLANSDALQLARSVDPSGDRTIGVLTKLDLMDAGTDALDILNNDVISLKLGFVGVVNRSQADINNGKPISAAREAEAEYFAAHPAYAGIAPRMGTGYLSRTLNTLLVGHIKKCLPSLKKRVTAKLNAAAAEMATLGAPVPPESRSSVVLDIITKFAADFKASLDGTMADLSMTELAGGARIAYIFHDLFFNAIQEIQPGEGLTEEDIQTLIRNATGARGALFMPGASFEVLVKKSVALLKEPAMQCVNLVYEELLRLLNTYHTKELARFSRLRERLHTVVQETFAKCLKPTYAMVTNLINVELAYINTRHPDFVAAMARMHSDSAAASSSYTSASTEVASSSAPPPSSQQPGGPAEHQQVQQQSGGGGWFSSKKKKSGSSASSPSATTMSNKLSPPAEMHMPRPLARASPRAMSETEMIRELLEAYFVIVKKNILDGVPKSIMLFLVTNSASHVQNELVKALYHESLFKDLTSEGGNVAARRDVVKNKITVLKKAERILNQIRDSY